VSVTVQEAIEHLYRVAVVEKKTTSPARLSRLAEFCVQELEERGLRGVGAEVAVEGFGRVKQWDVAWHHRGKARLGISLKSLLKNIPGTVPNRIDDLIGEVANAQLHSPEIVIGYIMVFDRSQDSYSAKHASTWLDLLRSRLEQLSHRAPPAWATGTFEGLTLAEVDFSGGPLLCADSVDFDGFFDRLVEHVKYRNPDVLAGDS
jgi:hypothetical protein